MLLTRGNVVSSSGSIEEALPLFKKVFDADRNWMTLLARLPRSRLFPDDPALVEKILAVLRK